MLNWDVSQRNATKISSGFWLFKHASDYGLTVSSFDKDFSAVVQRSRSVAENEQRSSILMKKIKLT
jgi:dihydrolipoamide dehydrogenase